MSNLYETYPEINANKKKPVNLYDVYKDLTPKKNSSSLKDMFSHFIRESAKQGLGQALGSPFENSSQPVSSMAKSAGYGALPAIEQLPTGIREGLLKSKAGLTGGEFTPSPVSDEYGAGFGRGAGQLLGQGAVVAPAATVGGLLGGPMGAIAGLGLATGATTPGSFGERALEGAESMALPVGGKIVGKVANKTFGKLPALLHGLTNKSTPEALVEAVQKPHDVLKATADEFYDTVRDTIKDRDIKIPMKQELLEQVTEHFPKNSRSYINLIEDAKKGDYEAIHKIQSSLYKKGMKAISNEDPAIENKGEDILDLREKINEYLNNNLLKEGHLDIVHALSQGKKSHASLKQTYYAKNLKKGVGKLVNPELRIVPKNPEILFDENSVPMKKFLSQHPEVARHMAGIKDKKAAHEFLKKSVIGAAGTGGTIYTAKTVNDLFK